MKPYLEFEFEFEFELGGRPVLGKGTRVDTDADGEGV